MNLNSNRKITLFLFIAVFLSALVWLAIIPIWHTPDEQSHFAQVAFIAEMGRNPGGGALDTTEEIYVSEQLLGTVRDKVGNNKFTFHPDYKIEYTDSYWGKYESSISALSTVDSKKKLVATEASYYPKSYYIPAAWLYKLFYSSDLFTRVFAVRGWSLFLFFANVFFVYRIGKLIFNNDKLKVLILTTLVGFQPMMLFSNIGVTSDALGNLLFTLFLYCCLRLVTKGLQVKEIGLITVVSWLTLTVKTQFVIILPVLFVLFTFLVARDVKGLARWIILLFLFLFAAIPLNHPYRFTQLSSLTVVADSLKEFNLTSFLKYTYEYTFPHTVKEVMPWYWGVYKWLGVTYPRIVHRIINRIVFVSAIGFVVWLIKSVIRNNWKSRRVQSVFFLLFTSAVYFISISVFDWLSWYKTGFQLGVQGRYFFPFISFQMVTFVLGWSTLLPNKWGIKKYGLKLLGCLMIILNIYALYYICFSYYDPSSLQGFIVQVSQYKPEFFKGNNILILLVAYFISLIVFVAQLVAFKQKQKAV